VALDKLLTLTLFQPRAFICYQLLKYSIVNSQFLILNATTQRISINTSTRH